MVSQYPEKVKQWFGENKADLFTAAVIFLVGIASFGLGRLSSMIPQKEPIRIEESMNAVQKVGNEGIERNTPANASDEPNSFTDPNHAFVASKSGSVYYAAWCSGANNI